MCVWECLCVCVPVTLGGFVVAQGITLLPHSTRGPGSIPGLATLCADSARSPCVCVGFLLVLPFPPTLWKLCWWGALAMLNYPSVHRRWSVVTWGFSQLLHCNVNVLIFVTVMNKLYKTCSLSVRSCCAHMTNKMDSAACWLGGWLAVIWCYMSRIKMILSQSFSTKE